MFSRNRPKRVIGRRRLGLAALTTLVAWSGCAKPAQRLRTETAATGTSALAVPHRNMLGTSVEGRPIECLVFGDGDDVVLILATIHGNEAAGTPLLRRLATHLGAHPELLNNRQVVLIPVANPDGLVYGTRHNARGVDLNRNFPASNWHSAAEHGSTALSEPESLAIHRALETYKPDRIVAFHQPISCIDYDGPARALAEAMAAHTTLPVRKLGGRSGSLGSYAGIAMGIPIITAELPASATDLTQDELWARYGRMLLAAICFPKGLPAE